MCLMKGNITEIIIYILTSMMYQKEFNNKKTEYHLLLNFFINSFKNLLYSLSVLCKIKTISLLHVLSLLLWVSTTIAEKKKTMTKTKRGVFGRISGIGAGSLGGSLACLNSDIGYEHSAGITSWISPYSSGLLYGGGCESDSAGLSLGVIGSEIIRERSVRLEVWSNATLVAGLFGLNDVSSGPFYLCRSTQNHVTVTRRVRVPMSQFHPVTVERWERITVPDAVFILVERSYPVHIPKPYPVTV